MERYFIQLGDFTVGFVLLDL